MPRVFVALRPPRPVRDALAATYGGVEGARWQSDEQLHLTLRFVGDVDMRTADELVQALSGVRERGLTLTVQGAGHFESRGKPNALWAAIAPCPALNALQASVEKARRSLGLPPEPRAFVPHVTLARLVSRTMGAGDWLARHGNLAAPTWPVTSFGLYESTLHPSGSRYTAIDHFPLRA